MTALPSAAPASGNRRFWITVTLFAILNVATWFAYHAWLRSQLPRTDILTVQSFAPAQDAILAADSPLLLSWTFNLDLGKPGPALPGPKGESPGTVQPAIDGTWQWTDPRTLTFESHDPPPHATQFTATLNPVVLHTTDGYTLGQPVRHTFTTIPLRLDNVSQIAFDGQDQILLELRFNDKVIPGEVLNHLKIEGPDGKPVHATLHGQGAGTLVRVLTDPVPYVDPANVTPPTIILPEPSKKRLRQLAEHAATQAHPNTLQVTITPGLVGASGPLGITEADTRSVPIATVLLADTLQTSLPAEGPADLTLSFNNEITDDALERIKPLLSIEPAVPFTAERRSWQNNMVILHGDFQPATRYTLKIAKLAQADDVRKYPRPATLSVFVPDRQPTAYFEHSTGYLGSKGNRTLAIKTVNVPAVVISAVRVYENNLVAWRNQKSTYADVDQFAKPVAARRYVLANKKNIATETHIDLDDLLGKEAATDGVYALNITADTSGSTDHAASGGRYWRQAYNVDEGSTALITLSDIGLTAKVMASPAPPGDASSGGGEQALLAWAVSLSTAKPLPNLKVRVYSNKNQLFGEGTTDADGLARIDHLNPAPNEQPAVVIAQDSSPQQAKSLTWLDLSNRRDESDFATAGREYLRTGYEAFVWSERGAYRPGETVVLRAIVRGANMSTTPDKMPVRWQIRRPDGHDWESLPATLDADGAAEWRITFPSDVPTGYWTAEIGLPGQTGTGSAGMRLFGQTAFQIEEFMPDRMKTALALSGPGLRIAPALPGIKPAGGEKPAEVAARLRITEGPLLADVQSDYLFGQPAANLQCQLTARIIAGSFSPKQFPAADGWLRGDTADAGPILAADRPNSSGSLDPMSQTLDKDGHTQFEVVLKKKLEPFLPAVPTLVPTPPSAGEPPQAEFPPPSQLYLFRGPWAINVSAATTEVGGRAVTTYASTDADGLPYYLMVRPTGYAAHGYIDTAAAATYVIVLVTPTGDRAPDKPRTLRARIFKESWVNTLVQRDGRYQYESNRILEPLKGAESQIKTTNSAANFSWRPATAGTYILEFADPQTLQITTLRLTVGQGGGWNDNISRANPEHLDVQLVAADPVPTTTAKLTAPTNSPIENRKSKIENLFHIGQNVKAIVRSPFPGRLLLTVETDTVLLSKVIDMTGSVAEVPLTLPEGVRPNGYIGATVVRNVEPNKEWRTHRAFGLTRFDIDSSDRRLAIKITSPTEIRPTRTLDVDLVVTDARGNPTANAAVALAAVDEGVLRVTSFATPNPLAFYNSTRSLGVQSSDLYSMLMPEVARPDGISKVGGGDSGDEDTAGFTRRHSSPVSAKRVKPVSLVSDIVHTDSAGKATVHLQVPEFLGQLRIMAIAYAGPLLGSSDGPVFVRSPLVVQTSFPRFLAPGDSAQVSLLVINNSPVAGSARLQLTSSNASVLSFDGQLPDTPLKPGEQKILTAKLIAHDAVGTSQIAVEATLAGAGGDSYTEHLEIPVRPASPMISRGAYAAATPGKPAALDIPSGPAGMLPGTGTFELRLAQRPALGLPEGLEYLNHYPYGCLEQTTSQCFPLVYLSDIGAQIAPGVFDKDSVKRKVDSGIVRLIGMQTGSGGLAMWPGSADPWPWGSVYAAHFLIEAEKAGYSVPEDFQTRLMGYVRTLLNTSAEPGPDTELQAYAAYVVALSGKPDRAVLSRLGEILDAAEKTPSPPMSLGSSRNNLALAWAAAGRKDLAEKLIPETLPQPRTGRDLAGNLGSPIRDQALLITTLLTISPDHPALPQLVERLSTAGMNRQWLSTQDNGLAIMAIGKYLRTTKDEKPFDSADLLDGGGGEKVLGTAMGGAGGKALLWSTADPPAKLTVRVKGDPAAKAYISWLQTGVPLQMPPDADHSLKIRRTYLTEDDKPLDISSLASGTAIKVQITIDSATPLSNLVIEDLLPAGLEIENPRLATTQKQDPTLAASTLTAQRLDIRDDRIILVTNIGPGASTWSYLARAVTPGAYLIPPVRAECMYDPSINSLHGGGAHMLVVSRPSPVVATRGSNGATANSPVVATRGRGPSRHVIASVPRLTPANTPNANSQ